MTDKRCPKCGETKNRAEFGKDNATKDGHACHCKVCRSFRKRIYDATPKGRAVKKASNIKQSRKGRLKRYGITPQIYKEMLDNQGGVCAICGVREDIVKKSGRVQRLSIDHCHRTGEVRGLLCSRCNVGLGNFEDDIDIMASAISYLQQK